MLEISALGVGVVADVAIYAALGVGVLRLRKLGSIDPANPAAVYRRLEKTLVKVFPDSTGDTLKELLGRARMAYPGFDWNALDREFEEYEAYKYGGRPKPGPVLATLKFANSVRGKKD
jgi:hypothetical protein